MSNANIWGLTGDEYRAGKHKIDVSPKPMHPALCELTLLDQEMQLWNMN